MSESSILKWFKQIAQIPRVSGNEKQISDWLLSTAKHMGLQAEQDEAYNVIVRKGKGQGVVLQGHLDMVGEKAEDSKHDFDKDPITIIEEDGWLHANGTTLGADNGIALAIALSLLEDNNPEYPPIEILMTTGEEVGLLGAKSLKPARLTSKMMINLDAEEEGVFLSSCAGGETVTLKFVPKMENSNQALTRLSLSGLNGGHSGLEIDKGRLNAIKELARLISESDVQIAGFQASGKFNAICRQAEVLFPSSMNSHIKPIAEKYLKHWQSIEPEATLQWQEAEEGRLITAESSKAFINTLCIWPNGVNTMSEFLPTLVESSSNMGLIGYEGEALLFVSSIRSSAESQMHVLEDKMREIAKALGASLTISGAYPGWAFEKNSQLRDFAVKVWSDEFGKEPNVTAVHGGLECGFIKAKYPDMEIISMGPDIADVHTPKEKVSIESAQRLLNYLRRLLPALAKEQNL